MDHHTLVLALLTIAGLVWFLTLRDAGSLWWVLWLLVAWSTLLVFLLDSGNRGRLLNHDACTETGALSRRALELLNARCFHFLAFALARTSVGS